MSKSECSFNTGIHSGSVSPPGYESMLGKPRRALRKPCFARISIETGGYWDTSDIDKLAITGKFKGCTYEEPLEIHDQISCM